MRLVFFIVTSAAVAFGTGGCGRKGQHASEALQPPPASRAGSPERVYQDGGAQNVPDVLPGDGGQTEGDHAISRRIRRAIMRDEELASAGSNITVSTHNGQVHLKGRVGSKQEQRAIAAMVEKETGSQPAFNDLQVKPNGRQ